MSFKTLMLKKIGLDYKFSLLYCILTKIFNIYTHGKNSFIKRRSRTIIYFSTRTKWFGFQLGHIEFQQNFLEKSKKEIYQQLEALEGKQTQVAQELETKYGRGTVNLESGEFVQA